MIPHMTFADTRRAQDCLIMKREKLSEARLHTDGDSCQWGAQAHQGLHHFSLAGRDPENEVIIFGGCGKDLFKGIGRCDKKTGKWAPPTEFASARTGLEDVRSAYYDGPTILKGRSSTSNSHDWCVERRAFHSDLVLFSDITLATDDAWTTEMHYRVNMVPGDGVQIAWRELMGRKRFAYAELTGEVITAPRLCNWDGQRNLRRHRSGLHSPLRRSPSSFSAWAPAQRVEITTQMLRKAWKEDIANELRLGFSTEMFVTATEHSPHEVSYWKWAHERSRTRQGSREER